MSDGDDKGEWRRRAFLEARAYWDARRPVPQRQAADPPGEVAPAEGDDAGGDRAGSGVADRHEHGGAGGSDADDAGGAPQRQRRSIIEISARGIVGSERLRRRCLRAARAELERSGIRGISNLQVTMLLALGPDRLTRVELARRLAVDSADLAKPVERLLEGDYIERRPAGVRLTVRGNALRDQMIDAVGREVTTARLGYMAGAVERADLAPAIAAPVAPANYDPAKYVTMHGLKNKRGWSIALIRRLLGPPDLVGLFHTRGVKRAKRLWLLSRVEKAELDPAFTALRHRVVRIARAPEPHADGHGSPMEARLDEGLNRLAWGRDER
jgi:DNA-binding MarR family transcriptional regulator